MATFVAEGVRIGIFAACARGAASIVADEVRSPRIAVTLSCEMNLRAIVAASPGLDPLSSTINSIGAPRTPPLPFISSTASCAPWTLETPKVERAPVKQVTAPILTPASAQQLDARPITVTRNNRPNIRRLLQTRARAGLATATSVSKSIGINFLKVLNALFFDGKNNHRFGGISIGIDRDVSRHARKVFCLGNGIPDCRGFSRIGSPDRVKHHASGIISKRGKIVRACAKFLLVDLIKLLDYRSWII